MKSLLFIFTGLILLSACNLPTESKQSSDNNGNKIMNSEAKYQVGNPHFKGQTTVEVKNNEILVSFLQGENTKEYKGKLSEVEASKFWENLTATNICSFNSDRAGIPGEAKILFSLKSETETCQTEVWESDRSENKDLQEAINLFQNLAKEVSKGEVQY